ncbi:MAG: D-glycerate dehydrogenase [Patescibacteria group bacterium]|nr:D-glycerate dehydrogenase [Patescibacteria group bacterium]
MIVFVTRQIPEAGTALLKEAGHEVRVYPKGEIISREELLEGVKGVDAVLAMLTEKIDAELLDAAGAQLKIVADYAVGYDNVDLEAARSRGVAITNTPDVLTATVAEYTFALVLALSHRVVQGDRFFRAGTYKGWEPMLLLGNDIQGKTLGIVGLGRIGMQLAQYAAGSFGMNVRYYDVRRNEEFERDCGARFHATLEELMPHADYVSIHVPLNPSTRHIINAVRLKLMKRSAYLINTSRGPVVDEAALVAALTDGTIRGAALDVFEHEPTPTPGLTALENVIVTPHIASATEETRAKMAELAARNIIEVLAGRPAPNAVQ